MAAPRLLAVALVTLLLVPLAGCFAPVEGVAIEGHQGQDQEEQELDQDQNEAPSKQTRAADEPEPKLHTVEEAS